MSERPRLLVLDLLESYVRERDVDVRLERQHGAVRGTGRSAREAIIRALEQAGVERPS